jgi:hypothetical protein
MTKQRKVIYTVSMDVGTHNAAAVYADKKGISLSALISHLLVEHMAANGAAVTALDGVDAHKARHKVVMPADITTNQWLAMTPDQQAKASAAWWQQIDAANNI